MKVNNLRQELCTVVINRTVSKITPMENSESKLQVKCPQCGLLIFYSKENKNRPFCSDRCKILDLGAWASEKFRVPTQEHADFAHPDLEPTESDDDADT